MQVYHGQPIPATVAPHPPAMRPRVRARRGQATDPHSIAERVSLIQDNRPWRFFGNSIQALIWYCWLLFLVFIPFLTFPLGVSWNHSCFSLYGAVAPRKNSGTNQGIARACSQRQQGKWLSFLCLLSLLILTEWICFLVESQRTRLSLLTWTLAECNLEKNKPFKARMKIFVCLYVLIGCFLYSQILVKELFTLLWHFVTFKITLYLKMVSCGIQ